MYPYIPAKKFTSIELKHLLISLFVLTLAFSLAFSNFAFKRNLKLFISLLPISFLVLTLAFVPHELAHKFVAQKYGCWSEYRMYPRGLLLALVFSFFGFVFAAPGAVWIQGYVDKKRNGKISVVGPLMNICIAIAFFPLLTVTSGLSFTAIYLICFINAFLGFFNLLPIPPLDGSKVFRWNIGIYIFILIISLFTLGLIWTL